ncbi:nucleotide-diphospho-sugar transferase [Meredithblackwellia eburnea MCA 4105]
MVGSQFAVVTLLTSDSYLPGALTAINSLLDVEGSTPANTFDTVCLVTPASVGHDSIKAIEKVFSSVIGVEQITTQSWSELDLLGRKDLSASLTKLHLFRLTQYRKVIFLDADTLILKPISPLFTSTQEHPFSAAPDSGWPDAFNSGFMVTTPSAETFDGLVEMMHKRGSWDGGDQGLLNDYFSNWNRLSFTYNVTPSAYYTYAPAYRRHGSDVSVLHFIGKQKPWHRGTRETYVADQASSDYYGLVNKWFDVYERHFGLSYTFDVAGRVVVPPSSFKSSFTQLPAINIIKPSPIQSPAPAVREPFSSSSGPIPIAAPTPTRPNTDSTSHLWDPARSSPPRDSSYLQMRNPLDTSTYENIWDTASHHKQRERFDAPKSYAPPPASTHEWYREVMKNKPDPKALKAVFPWEQKEEEERKKTTESRSFVEAANVAKASALAAMGHSPTEARSPQPASAAHQPEQPGGIPVFTNAWDSIPGIGRYANRLAFTTGAIPRRRQGSNDEAAPSDGLGSRKSSLMEPSGVSGSGGKSAGGATNRSDDGSRDGDDEDDEANDEANSSDEGQSERYKITFKVRDGTSYSASGKLVPKVKSSTSSSLVLGGGGGALGLVASTRTEEHRGVGTSSSSSSRFSAGHPHQHHHGHRSGSSSPTNNSSGGNSPTITKAPARRTSSTGSTSPRLPAKPVSELSPSTSAAPSGSAKSPRITTSTSVPAGQTSPLLATSPRLAAQALRNSTAARISSSGSVGDGPPLVRATRVFSPETNTDVVKQQGLAALERFVQNMNNGTTPVSPSGPPGTGGAFRQ